MEKSKSLDAKRMADLSFGKVFGFSFASKGFVKMGYDVFSGGLI